MKLDPKALGKAHSIMEEQLGFVVHSPIARDVVLTYLSNLQPSKEVRELVEELRETQFAVGISGLPACAETISRAADLLSRMDGEGWRPKAKALVWVDGSMYDLKAETFFGTYYIRFDSPRFYVETSFDFGANKSSLDAAKAAAQADYERRILSALAPSIEDPTQGSPTGGML